MLIFSMVLGAEESNYSIWWFSKVGSFGVFGTSRKGMMGKIHCDSWGRSEEDSFMGFEKDGTSSILSFSYEREWKGLGNFRDENDLGKIMELI